MKTPTVYVVREEIETGCGADGATNWLIAAYSTRKAAERSIRSIKKGHKFASDTGFCDCCELAWDVTELDVIGDLSARRHRASPQSRVSSRNRIRRGQSPGRAARRLPQQACLA
jgi:hypothetical protein